MNRYESLILVVPEITSDESTSFEKNLGKLITDNHGSMISFDRWGKFYLAYPIRKFDYGIYYLLRFEVDQKDRGDLLANLNNFFTVKYNELVMRNNIIKLDPNQSLEYQRPESLEEAPSHDVDTFLKDNKMNGLVRHEEQGA